MNLTLTERLQGASSDLLKTKTMLLCRLEWPVVYFMRSTASLTIEVYSLFSFEFSWQTLCLSTAHEEKKAFYTNLCMTRQTDVQKQIRQPVVDEQN